jgi:predicted amidohydrolase YtcJ
MSQPADILIRNARVYTVDETQPWAEAVAVRGNRIVFVGSAAEADSWRGPQTEVIDGAGRTLLPGLIDSHFHLLWGSLKLDDLPLWDVEDMDQLATLIRDYAAAQPQRAWIVGAQLRYKSISPERPLTRQFLDNLVADRPVYLVAYDGHTVWANTEALRRGGILHGRELPPGHEIVMDPTTGTATGELREPEAFKTIRDLIPQKTDVEKRALLHKGMALAARHGITSAHNMDTWDDSIHLYAALEGQGEMTLRLYVPYDVKPETPLDALHEAVAWKHRYQSSHLRAGAIKCFMDGVLESYTALMVDDYASAPGNYGSALFSAERFNKVAAGADRLGLQVAVHCCGDGAVKRALDGYAHARRVNGPRPTGAPRARHRIEHIEVVHPADIARFAELGVIASMQPLHAPVSIDAGDVWTSRAGEARWRYSFAWQTLRDAGAHLVFGSDWPVVSMDPMLGFSHALNRQPWAPGDPVQRQTLAQIIRGYTRDAAFVEFQEDEKGMIRAGMLADLVLLSEDIFATPHEEIGQVQPVLTICDGKIVYS